MKKLLLLSAMALSIGSIVDAAGRNKPGTREDILSDWNASSGPDSAKMRMERGKNAAGENKGRNNPALIQKIDQLQFLVYFVKDRLKKHFQDGADASHASPQAMAYMSQYHLTAALKDAVSRGDIDSIQNLLKQGADQHYTDYTMAGSILHCAILSRNYDVVNTLLSHADAKVSGENILASTVTPDGAVPNFRILTLLLNHKTADINGLFHNSQLNTPRNLRQADKPLFLEVVASLNLGVIAEFLANPKLKRETILQGLEVTGPTESYCCDEIDRLLAKKASEGLISHFGNKLTRAMQVSDLIRTKLSEMKSGK